MPSVPNQETAHGALVRVCNEIDGSGVSGTPDDYAFIRAILQDVVVDAMFQTHDKQNDVLEPVDHNANATVNRLLDQLDLLDQDGSANDPVTKDLFNLLADADMQAVLMAHDDIARKSFEPVVHREVEEETVLINRPMPQYSEPIQSPPPPRVDEDRDGPYKIVGVRRNPGEPLGITVGNDEGGNPDELVVVRIAENSTTARQGLVHVGDVIAEVNGIPVSTAEQLGDAIQRSGPDIRFKVLPVSARGSKTLDNQRYLRTHFAYNPHKDSRVSASSVGLAFEDEDILAIIKDTDKNWWECRNLRTGHTGKVPSPSFEEKKQASQASQATPDKTKSSLLCGLGKNKKKKKPNMNNVPAKPDEKRAVLYEEVIKVKPFRHRCLVLVGAQGLGRRSIKNRLIQTLPHEFGAPTPNTSRSIREGEVSGRSYHFLTATEMEADINNGKYLEFGLLNKNYYGTSLAALKVVIDSGKTCIIDPKAAALSKLRTIDWMPYVVFVKPTDPDTLKQMNLQALNDGVDTVRKSDADIKQIIAETKRIQHQFIHFCDTSIPYDNFDSSCKKIMQLLEQASTSPQWVPAAWESATERAPVTD